MVIHKSNTSMGYRSGVACFDARTARQKSVSDHKALRRASARPARISTAALVTRTAQLHATCCGRRRCEERYEEKYFSPSPPSALLFPTIVAEEEERGGGRKNTDDDVWT